jgi:hypothetical protein
MSGGVDAVAAVQQGLSVVIGGTWALGDSFKLLLTDGQTATQTLLGRGNFTGQVPTFYFVFDRKLYALAGPSVFFSAIDRPTAFNDLNGAGNSFLKLSNTLANPEDVTAMALFQGKAAFFSRRSVQVWNVDADPDKWGETQPLENIGTVAKLSVQSIGTWECVFLDDNGFRSLRARVATDNAEVNDLGSPIDTLVQAKLAGSTGTQVAAACGVVEPKSKRYWCFVNDTIYVLSYFPSAQIVAWSTYLATYQDGAGVQTAFVPQNFVVLNGQVFTRDGTALYAYGGADGVSYDNCVAQADTPFLDMQSPAAGKDFYGIDVASTGAWDGYIGTNTADSTDVSKVFSQNGSSYANASIPVTRRGTHLKMRFVSTGSTAAVVSKGILHFGSPYEK